MALRRCVGARAAAARVCGTRDRIDTLRMHPSGTTRTRDAMWTTMVAMNAIPSTVATQHTVDIVVRHRHLGHSVDRCADRVADDVCDDDDRARVVDVRGCTVCRL